MNAGQFLKGLIDRVAAPADPARSAARRAREVVELCHALMSERGEVSGAALAREVLAAYAALPANAHTPFLHLLAEEFSPDAIAIARAAADFSSDASPQSLIKLQHAVESPRQELFRRLNVASGATAALVDLRRRLSRELKTAPQLAAVDADLAHLFGSWFNRGFLKLERIDWRTPAIVLEKLIQYEAVHEIAGWKDLHRRLATDRRCFGFFHPALPDEPLIFIEVALTERISDAVAPLLDQDSPLADPARADSAIFYSITNCQEGLRGISFGNLLIKQVAEELSREFPRLKNFATLSPIPGFRRWLDPLLAKDEPELLSDEESASLASAFPAETGTAALAGIIGKRHWWRDVALRKTAEPVLTRLAAHYLMVESNGKRARDPVAHFHLSNGARVERLNMAGDTSDKGAKESATMMVNYLYDPGKIEDWHEDYAGEGKRNASTIVRRLARGWS